MNLENDRVIGIVGGMGPQAGLNLFNAILNLSEVTTDQKHFSTILMSLPKHITDRTSYLEGETNINPAYNIAKIVKKLEEAGANLIGLACNTSYSPRIYNVIEEELNNLNSQATLIHMPRETCKYIQENYPKFNRIGLMSTNGTYKSGLYKNLLEEFGFEVIMPDFNFQDSIIHRMIYDKEIGLKATPNKKSLELEVLLHRALSFFEQNKTDAIILGCTELSLLLKDKFVNNMLIVDPTEILAIALIREANVLTV